MFDTLWRDVRDSVRALLKRPRFTLTVVITLALGIGANATIFTWIKAILRAPLPGVAQPEQLVEIWGATRNNSGASTHRQTDDRARASVQPDHHEFRYRRGYRRRLGR
jgi:hypothetical protein